MKTRSINALVALTMLGFAVAPARAAAAPADSATPALAASTEGSKTKPNPGGKGPVIDHQVTSLDGKPVDLKSYRGKALLIVNTASKCGYTPQYADLEQVYEKYKDKGLVVLGFPCNDFGAQEPGSEVEIGAFCKKNYGVTFPMFAKIHTKGPEKAPLYKTLTEDTPEGIRGDVKWNFTKFLVDTQGRVVARFESPEKPTSAAVTAAIEKLLP